MNSDAVDAVARELRLDTDEMLVLTLMQQLMLGRDLIAEKNAARGEAKTRFRDEFARAAVVAHWSRATDLPEWARESAAAIAARVPAHQRGEVEAAAAVFGARIARRSRALLLLIELVAFKPRTQVAWVPRARREALAVVAGHLPALRAGDLDAVTAEFAAVARALARRNVRWGRVAVASAAGLALGVATMGAAAPLIGAAVGGALGLSGAAATSAGLAALGGGSVAAGGFGMVGGTALLTGLGAIGGAGAAAAGSRVSGWGAAQVVAEAVKLDVVTRLVILDAEGDDEKARRVVEGLQARLDEVTTKIGRLAEQLRTLSADNARLTVENEQLRRRLQAEQDDAEMAEAALQAVIDRIPVSV
jgi:outer membrane murein-binding lipoprotein Lpp